MKRKAFIVLFGAVLLLMATALTEYLFYRQDENTWVERFESRLHEQERKADHLLATFRDSVDIDSEEWEEDLIFVGIREGRVFFWQNGGHLQAFKTYLPNQLPALHLFLLRHNLFFQYNGIEKLSLTQILFPVFIRSFKILPDFMLFFRSSVSIKISI